MGFDPSTSTGQATSDLGPPLVRRWSGREVRALRHARRMSVREFAKHPGVSPRMVSKWEAGGTDIHPRPVNQEALDTSLSRSSPEAQALFRSLLAGPPITPPAGPGRCGPGRVDEFQFTIEELVDLLDGVRLLGVLRRDFLLRSGAAVTGGSLVGPAALLDMISRPAAPARVGREEIDQIHEARSTYRAWDFRRGSGVTRAAATAQLQWAAQLLEVSCPQRLRHDLLRALAWFGSTCAFMAFDDHAFTDADVLFRFAQGCAVEAGDHGAVAGLLSKRAMMATWTGQPEAALGLLDRAQAEAGRLTPTERAMLLSTRARAHAQLRDVEATVRSVGEADEELSRATVGDDPPWGGSLYYTGAEHAGSAGSALGDLVLGVPGIDPTEAMARQRCAVSAYGDEFARSRAHAQLQLASIVMATGDPDEAAAIGWATLRAMGPIRSRRSGEHLRRLDQACLTHASRPAVAELRAEIARS